MTYPPITPSPPDSDTPVAVDETPPYGEPSPWWRRLLLIGLVVALVVALFLAIRAMVRAARAVWTALTYETPRPGRGAPMVIVPASEPYAGPLYTVRFYDGNYRQLADLDLVLAADLTSPTLRLQLAGLARELQQRVEIRDGQRCFAPRIELLDGADRVVGEWP